MSASRLIKTAIKIPTRIERSPTDLLKALSSTVKHVPGQPKFSHPDDPYLLPARPTEEKLFTLSRLSGIKTAQFIFNKHPELFLSDDSEPKVESFTAPEEFRPNMNFTEDDIIWCLKNNDSINGIIAYKALQERKVKIKDETLLQFYELMCYSNEEKLMDLIDLDRARFASARELVDMTWKKDGIASKIFNDIKDDIDPSRVYSAMICGLLKYNERNAAMQVFDDFKSNHPEKALYTDAYSDLIRAVHILHSSVTTAHKALDEIVEHMRQKSVLPNLKVFNSILDLYARFNVDDEILEKALQNLNDMKSLEIDISFATVSSIIKILARHKNGLPHQDLIVQILNDAKNSDRVLEVRDSLDLYCMRLIMKIATNQFTNVKMANYVHQIYLKNPSLLRGTEHKRGYFDDYFKLIITTESLENIMEFYETYTMYDFEPSPETYDALFEAIDMYDASPEIRKRIKNDVKRFDSIRRMRNFPMSHVRNKNKEID